MKKKLMALLAKKEERKTAIMAKAEASNDVAELRALNTELDGLNEEIRSLKEMIAGMPDDAAAGDPAADDPDQRTAAVTGQIPGVVTAGAKGQEQRGAEVTDKFSTVEYRTAFKDYCLRGTPIPEEYRDDAFTAVADAAAVIPTTIMTEIVKEMKVRGQLYSRVRKTNIPAGVQVPILSLKPTASRITEAAVSARQKLQANTYISFSYYGLECKVATSLLTSAVSLPAFEAEIVPLIVEAMVTQCEIEVIKGTGEGQMLGVTVDTRVAAGQKITLTADEISDWGAWKKKVFAKIPLAYKAGGIFVMGAGTFDGYIDGMQDANGQPIGRVNYGIADAPQYRFGGKEVLEVEEDVIESYDSANAGEVIAVFMKPSDFCVNSNMQMAMYRWLDHDTNQWVDKAILINDGKLIDAAGVLIIKKG
ncbi:MAG: phage major capsid protein [Syntrophomonadaceae bacterium]|jgi:HK97 family phage major capsid protein|nr:phage major capsid protein [Syntrophomonadaceae bacterium]